MSSHSVFRVDESDETNRLSIAIKELGSVCINVTEEGVIIDVFPLHNADSEQATIALMKEDFFDQEEPNDG